MLESFNKKLLYYESNIHNLSKIDAGLNKFINNIESQRVPFRLWKSLIDDDNIKKNT